MTRSMRGGAADYLCRQEIGEVKTGSAKKPEPLVIAASGPIFAAPQRLGFGYLVTGLKGMISWRIGSLEGYAIFAWVPARSGMDADDFVPVGRLLVGVSGPQEERVVEEAPDDLHADWKPSR